MGSQASLQCQCAMQTNREGIICPVSDTRLAFRNNTLSVFYLGTLLNIGITPYKATFVYRIGGRRGRWGFPLEITEHSTELLRSYFLLTTRLRAACLYCSGLAVSVFLFPLSPLLSSAFPSPSLLASAWRSALRCPVPVPQTENGSEVPAAAQ